MALKTNVYIDGFNFYYGCIKKTPYRWLDLSLLCRRCSPKHQIHRIRYFTALVTPRPSDPEQRTRQETYLRALTDYSEPFHTPRAFSLEQSLDDAGRWKWESRGLEIGGKGLRCEPRQLLLIDAYSSDCDVAVIVSNDSDLVFPIEHIKKHLGKMIGILNPHPYPSRELLPLANFYKPIATKLLPHPFSPMNSSIPWQVSQTGKLVKFKHSRRQ